VITNKNETKCPLKKGGEMTLKKNDRT